MPEIGPPQNPRALLATARETTPDIAWASGRPTEDLKRARRSVATPLERLEQGCDNAVGGYFETGPVGEGDDVTGEPRQLEPTTGLEVYGHGRHGLGRE